MIRIKSGVSTMLDKRSLTITKSVLNREPSEDFCDCVQRAKDISEEQENFRDCLERAACLVSNA